MISQTEERLYIAYKEGIEIARAERIRLLAKTLNIGKSTVHRYINSKHTNPKGLKIIYKEVI